MPKKVIVHNSHSLKSYKQCPQQYKLSFVEKLEPRQVNKAFARGTVISRALEDYYKALRDGKLTPSTVSDIAENRIKKSPDLTDEEKFLIEFRFYRYFKNYKPKELGVKILGVEHGFSIVLYEDNEYIFVYEGCPDLVVLFPGIKVFGRPYVLVMDHKSQAYNYAIYPHNDQALGYCKAARTNWFAYNFFGLQATKDEKTWFHRELTYFTDAQIAEWTENTIYWYWRSAKDLEFRKTLNCTTQFGTCQYARLCEITDPLIQLDIKRRGYKISTYQSW